MSVEDSISTELHLSIAEFMRLFEQEGPFELIDGERIPILPGVAEHSEIIKLVYQILLPTSSKPGKPLPIPKRLMS